ncbi:EAL domain-containing protein [Colwellia sp. M166]|uniref:EAL and HDOD domain-containing protein n=1 Tax=Colwellia sp. M166 TaxID=2583805 RepID=UPI00211EF696|nr:HDOD domain-containing protein [Colwellia sp. M166]UUO23689.1 EAL domain-containing protein [Colwellia sp. M166]|tara:strand:+ start:101745 stop:102956 length:1212 start_codon:yes stop_codon:yes gene_type:complete
MYSFIARQPILDLNQSVVAYELLFRDGESNCFPDIDPDQATSNILSNNHLTLGVENITNNLPAYINFHSNTLINDFPSFLDPSTVVIEILEDVPASDALLSACKQLSEKGYILALDDHDFDPKWQRFFPYINLLKIDVLQHSMLAISKFIRTINNSKITLLAEKVETAQQFEQTKLLGFTLFQGYFFAKPEMLKQKKVTSTKQKILELVGHASCEQLNFDTMGEIFSSDPGLTYKLLRFINNPCYGRSQEITSLKHALIYLGDIELKKFIALLALADLNHNKPTEIIRLSLIRAKFCEQISLLQKNQENPPKAFLTGILSFIDGILDHTLATLLNILPVHADIKQALMTNDNYLAHYLNLAKSIEMGHWQASDLLIEQLALTHEQCFIAHTKAITWADEMLQD